MSRSMPFRILLGALCLLLAWATAAAAPEAPDAPAGSAADTLAAAPMESTHVGADSLAGVAAGALVPADTAAALDSAAVRKPGGVAEEPRTGARSYAVPEVQVTATKLSTTLGETPAEVTVIDRSEIEANAERNLIGLLGRQEGVNPGSYGSFGALELIGLRGARSGRTPVELDGVPLNNAQNGDVDFNTVPASFLERIEIVRGPIGTLHGGNGIAGMVNLVTVEPERDKKPVSVVGVSSGSLSYRKHIASFSRRLGRAGMILGLEDAGTDDTPPYKEFAGRNFFGKFDYDFGSGSEAGVLFMSHSGTLKTLNGAKQKTEATRVQASGGAPLGDKVRLRVGAFGSDEGTEYRDPFSWTLSDLDKYGATLDAAVDGTPAGDLVWGGGYKRNTLSARDALSKWEPVTNEGYVFGGTNLRTGQWLRSLVSLRADFHSDYGNELSPYCSLWHEAREWMAWFSIGRGFNPPTMNDLFWPTQTSTWGGWSYVTTGNRHLAGESSWMGEVGSRFALLNGSVRGDATCYASRTEDYIEWVSSVSYTDFTVTYRPENTDQVDAVGAEMALEILRRNKPLAGANLTLQNVEDRAGAKVPYMPESRLNVWLTHAVEPFSEFEVTLRVDATQVGKYVEPFGSTQGPFILLEGKLSGSMAGFTAFARLRNVTDDKFPSRSLMSLEEGRPAEYYPMQGRNYEIGLLWRLLD